MVIGRPRFVYLQNYFEITVISVLKTKCICLFSGQMLLNWFISSITENNHFKTLLSVQDLRNLGIQYCTHLLAAGVLRQISDKDAPTENIFKVQFLLTFIFNTFKRCRQTNKISNQTRITVCQIQNAAL